MKKTMIFEPTKKIICKNIKASTLLPIAKEDIVIEEKPLTIIVTEVGSFTLLSTPCAIKELAVGFIFSEGIIDSANDILEINDKDLSQMLIAIKVKNPQNRLTKRNLIVTSGCGLCGKHNIDNILLAIHPTQTSLTVAAKDFPLLANKVYAQQKLFQQTGATHTAAIFDNKLNIMAMHEDLARHCALDKAIGDCLLKGISLSSCGVFLSSRVSFEMVVKAARAGIEMIVAVSAPSALALKAAEYWNITLCGFVRGENGNVYTGIERLK